LVASQPLFLKTIQTMLDGVLNKITLRDLFGKENEVEFLVTNLTEEMEKISPRNQPHSITK